MKRPMLYVFVFLIFGIIGGQYTSSFGGIVLFSLLMFSVSFVIYNKINNGLIFMFPFISLLGMFLIFEADFEMNRGLSSISQISGEAKLLGTAYDIYKTENGNESFVFEVDEIEADNKIVNENIKVRVYLSEGCELKEGQRLIVKGVLKERRYKINPFGINAEVYEKINKIRYNLVLAKIVFKGDTEFSLKSCLYSLRNRLEDVYDKIFFKEDAAIIKAMVLGYRYDISSETIKYFKNSGMYHVIAISGLHIGILVGAILFFTDKIHKRYGKVLAIIFAILYCIFSGASVSVVRAVIMICIMLFGKIVYKGYDVLSAWALSGVILLLYEPNYLFDIGFQYSFLAVLGLIIFTKPFERLFGFISFGKYFAPVLAVSIFTRVVTAYYFYKISVLDTLCNIILLPFAGIIVFFGLVSGIIGMININLGGIAGGIAGFFVELYEIVCKAASEIPFCNYVCGKPGFLSIFIYLCIVCCFAYMMRAREGMLKHRLKIFIIVTCLGISFLFLKFALKTEEMYVSVLDVGQGDCIVLNKGSKCIVIDGGGENEKLGSGTGVNVLMPYIHSIGTDSVEAVYITHFDNDHVKGILELIGNVDIKKIYISDIHHVSENYKLFTELTKKYSIPVYKIKAGYEENIADIRLRCIYPIQCNLKDKNENSLVLRADYGEASFMFTGDIGENEEKNLIESGSDLDCDVLKLAHHGSEKSNSKEFIDAVTPEYAVVSAGKDNSYGHPSKAVLKRLKENNIPCYSTSNEGAVIFKTDGKRLVKIN